MAHVFNRTTGQFLQSVNTPDFDVADWVLNPDLVATVGQPVKYWFIPGTTNPEGQEIIGVVDAAAQAVIDADLTAARIVSQKDGAKNEFDVQRVLPALAELLVDEFNNLRTLHALPDRTFSQLRTAIRGKIDSAP